MAIIVLGLQAFDVLYFKEATSTYSGTSNVYLKIYKVIECFADKEERTDQVRVGFLTGL